MNNSSPSSDLQTLDIGFGIYDPTGRLSVHKLESIANTALADLMPTADPSTREHVPWILTLNAGLDSASRETITDQYRSLDAGRAPNRRLTSALSGRDHT